MGIRWRGGEGGRGGGDPSSKHRLQFSPRNDLRSLPFALRGQRTFARLFPHFFSTPVRLRGFDGPNGSALNPFRFIHRLRQGRVFLREDEKKKKKKFSHQTRGEPRFRDEETGGNETRNEFSTYVHGTASCAEHRNRRNLPGSSSSRKLESFKDPLTGDRGKLFFFVSGGFDCDEL